MTESSHFASTLGEARVRYTGLKREKEQLEGKLGNLYRKAATIRQTQEWYLGVMESLKHESSRPEMGWREVVPIQHQVARFATDKTRNRLLMDHYWTKYGEDLWDNARSMEESFVKAVGQSTAVWVHHDIMDTILAAVNTLPRTVYLHATDLVFRNGFAVLQSEFATPDYHGENVALSGVSWHQLTRRDGVAGIAVWLYAYSHSAKPPYPKLCFGWPHFIPLDVGTEIEADDPLRRLCAAFLLMIGQPIVEQSTETTITTKKQGKKRWQREDAVTALTLRRVRRSSSEYESSGRQWQHRWVVSAHWRNQWYPSEQIHKTILVGPYVKGPDDKPLLTSEKVYRWVR